MQICSKVAIKTRTKYGTWANAVVRMGQEDGIDGLSGNEKTWDGGRLCRARGLRSCLIKLIQWQTRVENDPRVACGDLDAVPADLIRPWPDLNPHRAPVEILPVSV
jgi:hypothetical protein